MLDWEAGKRGLCLAGWKISFATGEVKTMCTWNCQLSKTCPPGGKLHLHSGRPLFPGLFLYPNRGLPALKALFQYSGAGFWLLLDFLLQEQETRLLEKRGL